MSATNHTICEVFDHLQNAAQRLSVKAKQRSDLEGIYYGAMAAVRSEMLAHARGCARCQSLQKLEAA